MDFHNSSIVGFHGVHTFPDEDDTTESCIRKPRNLTIKSKFSQFDAIKLTLAVSAENCWSLY